MALTEAQKQANRDKIAAGRQAASSQPLSQDQFKDKISAGRDAAKSVDPVQAGKDKIQDRRDADSKARRELTGEGLGRPITTNQSNSSAPSVSAPSAANTKAIEEANRIETQKQKTAEKTEKKGASKEVVKSDEVSQGAVVEDAPSTVVNETAETANQSVLGQQSGLAGAFQQLGANQVLDAQNSRNQGVSFALDTFNKKQSLTDSRILSSFKGTNAEQLANAKGTTLGQMSAAQLSELANSEDLRFTEDTKRNLTASKESGVKTLQRDMNLSLARVDDTRRQLERSYNRTITDAEQRNLESEWRLRRLFGQQSGGGIESRGANVGVMKEVERMNQYTDGLKLELADKVTTLSRDFQEVSNRYEDKIGTIESEMTQILEDKYNEIGTTVDDLIDSGINDEEELQEAVLALNNDYTKLYYETTEKALVAMQKERDTAFNQNIKLQELAIKQEKEKGQTNFLDKFTGKPSSAPSGETSTAGMKIIGTGDTYTRDNGTQGTLGDNCVKYGREQVTNLPWGLHTKADKQEAVKLSGFTDLSQVQIGDAVLTAEGDVGHVAIVQGFDGNNLILDEANYTPGKVTQGRTLDANSGQIYGFIHPSTNIPRKIGNIEKEGTNAGIEAEVKMSAARDSAIDFKGLQKRFDVATSSQKGEIMDELASIGELDNFFKFQQEQKGDVAKQVGMAVSIFGKRVSDGEREAVGDILQQKPNATRDEVMLEVLGFDTKNNKDLGVKLINTVRTGFGDKSVSEFDVAGLSSLLNKGDVQGAIKKVENALIQEVEGTKETPIYVENIINSIDAINKILPEIDEDLLGPFDGSTFQAKKRFFTSDEELNAAQELAGELTGLVAEMRNRLSGTAVTESEAQFLEPLIPSINDQPGIMISKLNALKNTSIRRLNTLRQQQSLPTVSNAEILNPELVPGLYGQDVLQSVLQNFNINPGQVQTALGQAGPGQVAVVDFGGEDEGMVGIIPEEEFDKNIYLRLK